VDGSGLEEIVSCLTGQAGSISEEAPWQQVVGQQGVVQHCGVTSDAAGGGGQHGAAARAETGQMIALDELGKVLSARKATAKSSGTSRRCITTSLGGR
jgi:hypothetical protein